MFGVLVIALNTKQNKTPEVLPICPPVFSLFYDILSLSQREKRDMVKAGR